MKNPTPAKKSQTILIAADALVKLISDLKGLPSFRGCSIPVSRTWAEGLEAIGIFLDEVAPTPQSSEDEDEAPSRPLNAIIDPP